MSEREKRDLVLTPEQYAFMQEVTNGLIKTYVGPTVINQTAQDRPVQFVTEEGSFRECRTLEEAVRKAPVVPEGFYLVLKNPADGSGDEHPPIGAAGKNSPVLKIGRKVNIPGPVMFALWPGQDAQVIRGHHLRSNQYLIVRVYNEEEARENWGKAVLKKASEADGSSDGEGDGVLSAQLPDDLTVGKQLVIKGTEVSFYIPPTGISVVPENGRYVRDALTLERLEYCILVDENGNKRYERGPQVVFPEPTETFITNKGERKFRAIELNEIQGLHIKVIAPYTEDDGTERKEGDELFITGKQTAIYFPREEHSIIRYDGKSKHFATAVPDGEGRYVMNRMTGEIKTVNGPAMLLPDPRTQVIVRRVLSQRQCKLWYPNNDKVMAYNQHLESLLSNAPTTRSGVISEGDFTRGTKKGSSQRRYAQAEKMLMESSTHMDQHLVGEEFTRGSTYTEPRTVTLDTKLQGVPTLDIWNGYAVMVRNKTGERRVVEGPATILLGYDESLEVIELSTGKPKTTDDLLKTVYLRVKNNFITDKVDVETSDKVKVEVKIQLRGSFVGDPAKWFDVENYVKQVCDHVRSVLKGRVRGVTVAQFHAVPEDFIRDAILGTKEKKGTARPGMMFEQFGFNITDVEIFKVEIKDARVRNMLDQNQLAVVSSNLELTKAQRDLESTKELETIAQNRQKIIQATKVLDLQLQDQVQELIHNAAFAEEERRRLRSVADRQDKQAAVEAQVARDIKLLDGRVAAENLKTQQARQRQELSLARLTAETEAVVAKAQAVSPELAHSINTLAETRRMADLLQNFGEMAAVRGIGTVAAAEQLMDFLPEGYFRKHSNTPQLTDGDRDDD